MERASRIDRFWASVIDWWIFLSPLALVIPVRDESPATVVAALLLWAGAMAYQLVLAGRGQSIGKQLRGLRVVRNDGSAASRWRIVFLRNALPCSALLVPYARGVLALVDAVFILRSDQRCLHDLLADTQVVTVVKRRANP